jgi:hypothetical protein
MLLSCFHDTLGMPYNGKGFHSGIKRIEGAYQQIFNGLGTMKYTSSSVIGEDSNVFLSGTIKIKAPDEAILPVIVKFNDDVIAAHNPSGTPLSGFFPDASCVAGVGGDITADTTNGFTFETSLELTPTVSDISLDSSNVTVSTARGYFEGTNTPVFTITGEGFGSDAICQNSITLGNTSCIISTTDSTSITCAVTDPLQSATNYLTTILVSNHGLALIGNSQISTYNVVPLVSSMSPIEGSLAGGGFLTIIGKGFISKDNQALVAFVGPDQNPHACEIETKTDTSISCHIPQGYASSGTDVVAKVLVRIGAKQLPPAQSDGLEDTFEFSFKQSLTPSVGSITGESIAGGGGSIVVVGSGFGTDSAAVNVLLVPVSNSRRKRSIEVPEEHQDTFVLHTPLHQRSMSTFFKEQLITRKRENIRWRLAGSASTQETVRDYTLEDALNDPLHSGVSLIFDDDYESDQHVLKEDHEAHSSFVYRHKRSTLERSITRHKRSIANHYTLREVEEADTSAVIIGTVDAVTDTSIDATFSDVPAGTYTLQVTVDVVGNALNDPAVLQITSVGQVDSISPTSGSVYGEQLITITGAGFYPGDNDTSINSVVIGTIDCLVQSVTFNIIHCLTQKNSVEAVDVVVTVSAMGTTYPNIMYSYLTTSTPTIVSMTPSGASGDSIGLNGALFDADPSNLIVKFCVDLKNPESCEICEITVSTEILITCTVPVLPGGVDYIVTVRSNSYGVTDGMTSFGMDLSITSMSPTTGSKGGGTAITLTGVGFDTVGDISVTVCDQDCEIVNVISTAITCLTPVDTSSNANQLCDVLISQKNVNRTSPTQFDYDVNLTPMITSVTPNSGGSGGGTVVTIVGTGFDAMSNVVMIDGSECIATSQSETQIVCATESHIGSGTFPVHVQITDKGNAALPADGSGHFKYVDRWSSIWSWGGLGLPIEGDFVVLQAGQEILLDITTPKFVFLFLNGGHLIFDSEKADLILNSEYILIMNDGVLQV